MSTKLTNGIYTFADGESDWGTLMNSNLQILDNLVGNHGSTVSFSQTLTSGVKIGKITINGTEIELYHTDYSGKADADTVYTKTEVDDFLEDKADADDLTTHTDDDDIHVTALQKQSWTNKQDALTDEQLANIDSISELDEKYISADDTTIVKLTNLNEINLQEDHYNAWFGYRDGKVTNWKFGDGTEGGLGNVYAKDFYLNGQKLSDLLDGIAENSDLTDHTSNANIHVTVSDKNKWNGKQDALSEEQLNNINDVVNKANDNEVIHKSGNETAEGVKTFSDGIVTTLLNSKTPETIEEQGDGYIRYSNGIQICWGKFAFIASSKAWGSLYENTNLFNENYPKSFKSAPVVTAGSIGESFAMIESSKGTNVKTPDFYVVRPFNFTDLNFVISYIAIGMWK